MVLLCDERIRVEDASASAASASETFELASHSTHMEGGTPTDMSATGIGPRAPALVSDAPSLARDAKAFGIAAMCLGMRH